MSDFVIDSVIYISTAKPDLKHQDFLDIIQSSKRKNADNAITGVLCFNGNNFLQFLEGQREVINTRLAVIESDNRHTGMIILQRRNAAMREFPDWHMASSVIDTANYAAEKNISDILAVKTVTPETRKIIGNFGSLGLGL